MKWNLILHLLTIYFLDLFTPTLLAVNDEGGGLLLSFFLGEVPVCYCRCAVFFSPEIFVSFIKLSTKSYVSLACVLTTCVCLPFLFRISWAFRSNWVKRVLTAFEKIDSGFGFNLRIFCMACGLGMRFFIRIWMISVCLLILWQFRDKACWFEMQWWHLT